MIDFLIFYEVKNREFESIVLLRNKLVSLGYSVSYISFFQINDRKLIHKYKNNVKVAVMPSLYHNNEIINIVYHVAGKVKNIVNLRWEQVGTNDEERRNDSYMYPTGMASKAFHCCWGKIPEQMFLRAGISKDNLRITGPIHIDFLQEHFRKYFKTREELFFQYNINTDKPTLLFISSFVFATMTSNEVRSYIKQIGENKKVSVTKRVERDKHSYKEILKWLENYAKSNECQVIYRPHPVENITDELKTLGSLPNFRIIGEENVKQWILCCDVILTWYSTSIVEAYFAHIPFCILRPDEIPLGDDISIYNNASFIKTEEEFKIYCQEYARKGFIENSNINSKLIEEYFEYNVTYPSHKRTADYLGYVLHTEKYFNWEEMCINFRILDTKQYIRDILVLVYRKSISILNYMKEKGVKMPAKLIDYINNFMVVREKDCKNIISKEEFRNLERLLIPFVENE